MKKILTYFRIRLGMLRSIAAYYWKPFNLRRLKNFYGQFIQTGDLCFDIGAHLGNRSHAWCHLGAKVIAVEPQPRCIAFMERKFKGNPNITIVPKALGAKPGKLPMHISHLAPTVSTFADRSWQEIMDDNTGFKVRWEEKIEVEITTLDQLIETYGIPAFTKIDVEDFEVEVLKGLSRPLPALSVEFLYKTLDRIITCIDLLEALGEYEYNWSYAESQQLASKEWIDAAAMKKVFLNYSSDAKFGDMYARVKNK